MPRHLRQWNLLSSPTLAVSAVVIGAVTFVLDTITDLDVAFSVLYVAVILMAVRILNRRGVLLVCLACLGLTALSALVSLNHPLQPSAVINGLISIAAIVATTYLGLKNQSAGMALQDARAELAYVNRVATLGELTAAIAHEVNQPIAGTVTNAEAALHWLTASPPNLAEAREALDGVVEDGKRASEIIARTRALMAKSPSRRDRLDINTVVADVIGLTRNEIQRNRVALQSELTDNLPAVLGDRIQLQQVLLNLMLNAFEAMDGNGIEPRRLLLRTDRNVPTGIRVTVRDTGPGLNSASSERVFEAFYSTKPDGVGVGLSICRSIVEAHEGQIWASANQGRGASFQFVLPEADA